VAYVTRSLLEEHMRKTVALSAVMLLSAVALMHAACSKPPAAKERSYGSERPLYLRMVFGKEGGASMLGVVDESEGTGTGYNTAYVDENMNGDLTDEQPKKFQRNSRTRKWVPRFDFEGPLGEEEVVKYTLNIYSLARRKDGAAPGDDYYFFWGLDTEGWNYFFINGKMTLSSSAADAQKAEPLRLGGGCRWEIRSRIADGKVLVSAGLKDDNGSTLRVVRGGEKERSPALALSGDGQAKTEEEMEFG
jgi:hypothetical protein